MLRQFGLCWMIRWRQLNKWTGHHLWRCGWLETVKTEVDCPVHYHGQILSLCIRLHETHADFTSLEWAGHPYFSSSVLQCKVTECEQQEKNPPRNCRDTDCNRLRCCFWHGQWLSDWLELCTDCWDACQQLHTAAAEACLLESVCCNDNNLNWTWKWTQITRKWSWRRYRRWNYTWLQECLCELNWLRSFVSRISAIYDGLLITYFYFIVWNRPNSCPGGVLCWLGGQLSLYKELQCNLPLLMLAH